MKSPIGDWLPWYGDDFWGSERVQAMEDAAALLYQFLLWREWRYGPLPDDAEVLERCCPRGRFANFAHLWSQVRPCFDTRADGRLESPRLELERGKQEELHQRRSAAGRQGNLARWNAGGRADAIATGSQPDRKAIASEEIREEEKRGEKKKTGEHPPHPPQAGGDPASPPAEARSGRSRKKPKPEPWEPVLAEPEFAALQAHAVWRPAWERWASYRREIGKALRSPQTARSCFRAALKVGPEQYAKAIELAIEEGWTGIHLDALNRGGNGTSTSNGAAHPEAQPDPAAKPVLDLWCFVWERIRKSTYALMPEDPAAALRVAALGNGNEPIIRDRMARMLRLDDEFHRRRAGLPLLANRWNEYAQ